MPQPSEREPKPQIARNFLGIPRTQARFLCSKFEISRCGEAQRGNSSCTAARSEVQRRRGRLAHRASS
eukprot:96225-Rhodomonas_salina.1